jgi:hypothetical protein
MLEEDTPDSPMLKRLVSTFDSKTGRDSIRVHGQVRPVREMFFDGTRYYMAPPNRPYDRELLVPHRPEWGERLPALVRVPPAERPQTSAPAMTPARPPPRPRRVPDRPSILAAAAAVTLLAGQLQETRRAARALPPRDRSVLDQQQRAIAEQLRAAQVRLALERLAETEAQTSVASIGAGDVLSAGGVEVRVVAVRGGLALQVGDRRLVLALDSRARLPLRREAPVVRATALEAAAVLSAIAAATARSVVSRAA